MPLPDTSQPGMETPALTVVPGVSLVLLAASGGLLTQSGLLLVVDSRRALQWNLVLQLVLLVSVTVWSKRRTGSYLNPILLFVASIYFWHSMFLTGYVFSLNPLFAYTGNTFTYGQEYLGQATAAVSLCMAASCIGAFIGYSIRLPQPTSNGPKRTHVVSPLVAWSIFVLCATVTLLYLALEGGDAFQSGYFGQYLRNGSETPLYRLFSATKYFGVLAILLIFASARTRVGQVGATVAALTLIVAHLLFGSRSMPFVYGLSLLVSIDYFIKRIPLWVLAVVAVVGSAVSFIVAQTRVVGIGLQIFDFSAGGQSLNLLAILWEAGTVVKTVLRTMAFSAQTGLEWGKTLLDAALSIVPTPFLSTFHVTRDIMRPSVWLVENSSDLIPGAGLGYSLVAESYLNFGMLGFILFLVLGWLLAIENRRGAINPSSLAHLVALNMGVLLALHMRNDVDAYFRVLFWSFVIVAVVRRLSGSRRHTLAIGQESYEAGAFTASRLHGLQGDPPAQSRI